MIPGAPQSLFGIPIHVSQDFPRYVLPEEIIPGVPWGPGFRDEINAWAREFFQPVNLLKDGEVLKTPAGFHMNPRTLSALRKTIRTS